MMIRVTEHIEQNIFDCNEEFIAFKQGGGVFQQRYFQQKINKTKCFLIDENTIRTNYFIGIDWLSVTHKKAIYVAPKINLKVIDAFKEFTDEEEDIENCSEVIPPISNEQSNFRELNYLKMFLDACEHPEVVKEIDHLVFIDWESDEIEIEQKEDLLTPFLIIQFLNLIRQIVRKGLKKSYYKVQNNLDSRIKGKILVGQNIKSNIVKNRFTKTICEYQEFGIDYPENRFLKKVLGFVSNYIGNNKNLFKDSIDNLLHIISYCKPAFENVSSDINEHELKNIKTNLFFKEYKKAIKLGQNILRRFAYNISNTSVDKITTPPFWIDMPRLFELYVYGHLLKVFPNNVQYQFSTYGNELDFLITLKGNEMVVDAKYKLHYSKGHIHSDIRQVAGYARLKKVYNKLGFPQEKVINCLIIYPTLENECIIELEEIKTEGIQRIKGLTDIKAYNHVYKLGVSVPYI